MIKDLTGGDPLKLIILFSIPLLIGAVFQQLYNLADIVIVGRTLGVNAFAAVGSTAPIFFFIMFVIIGLTNGFAIITGQRFGAKDYTGVRRSVVVSFIISIIFTIFFTIICFSSMNSILKWMNIPQEIYNDAYSYIQIIVSGLFTVTIYNLLTNIIRALGDSKTPLYFLIVSSIANIFLALLFILKFHMGVPGSAIAVVITQALSGILCLIFVKMYFPILHLTKQDWIFSPKNFKKDLDFALEHLKIGIPMALQFTIIGIGTLIVQSVCNTFGPDVIAAFTASLRIEQIAIMPMASFGIALAAFVAQNFGAMDFSRIRISVKKASLINIGVSIIMAIIMHFFGSDIVRVFIGNQNPNVVKIAHDYLFISSMFYFFFGQVFIYRNALQGLSLAVIPLAASLGELIIRASAALYLAVKVGYHGIFYAGPIAWVTVSTITAAGYFVNIKRLAAKTKKSK